MATWQDKPLAVAGLNSYRYRGPFGWIMIGARDHEGALNEAKRSTDAEIDSAKLEFWDGGRYVLTDISRGGKQRST